MTVNNSENSRLKQNLKLYKEGKNNFTTEELTELKVYLLKYKHIVSTTEFYEGNLKDYKVVSCFAEELFTDLHDYMLKKFNADIAIAVIIKDRKILFKCNKEKCKIDLCTLAKLLSDGDCIDASGTVAEGNLTDKFLTLTKNFKLCM